jgi:hypothetical protein
MKLSEVIPWGRSYEEYRRMFALTANDLAGAVLGCGGEWLMYFSAGRYGLQRLSLP